MNTIVDNNRNIQYAIWIGSIVWLEKETERTTCCEKQYSKQCCSVLFCSVLFPFSCHQSYRFALYCFTSLCIVLLCFAFSYQMYSRGSLAKTMVASVLSFTFTCSIA